MGSTAYGRGGGTGPCGWWVVYAFESPFFGVATGATPINTYNLAYGTGGATMNMWTDNSLVNTLGAFALAGLASIVY